MAALSVLRSRYFLAEANCPSKKMSSTQAGLQIQHKNTFYHSVGISTKTV